MNAAWESGAREAVRKVLDIVDATGASPNDWHVRGTSDGDGPIVELRFRTLADLRRFAAAEKAKVEFSNGQHRQRHDWTALYDRPGRRMLLAFHAFPHSPEWEERS